MTETQTPYEADELDALKSEIALLEQKNAQQAETIQRLVDEINRLNEGWSRANQALGIVYNAVTLVPQYKPTDLGRQDA